MKDLSGVIVSSLCFIACLFSAFALGASGFASFAHDERLHILLLVPVVVLALWSLPKGFIYHGRARPLMFGLTGLMLVFAPVFQEGQLSSIVSVAGSILLISAHLQNHRLNKAPLNNGQKEAELL